MKRMLLVVAMLALAVALAGCHGKKVKPATTAGEGTTPAAGEVTQPGEAEKPVQAIPQPEFDRAEDALRDIHFDYDRYNITDEAADVLSANGEYLLNHGDVRILIEGHCDERGTEEYNLALGEKRALAARDYLVRFGIDRSKISIISYGEERPEDLGGTEEAWAKNRRAHFSPK